MGGVLDNPPTPDKVGPFRANLLWPILLIDLRGNASGIQNTKRLFLYFKHF